MTLDTLVKLAEFIGGAAVVISLIYLALQARQSAQMEKSENYGRVFDMASAIISRVIENAEVANLMIVGSTNIDEMETVDRVRFGLLMYDIFGAYEFVFEQSQAKALPKHVWAHYLQHLEFWSSLPGVKKWWASKKAIFSAHFMDIASAYIEKPGLSPEETREMWRTW